MTPVPGPSSTKTEAEVKSICSQMDEARKLELGMIEPTWRNFLID